MSAHPPFNSRAIDRSFKYGVVLSLFVSAAAVSLSGCGNDSLTGLSQPGIVDDGVNPNLIGVPDDGLGGDDDDHDAAEFPFVDSERHDRDDDEAEADPGFRNATETTFPVTEAMYNTCVDELVVLNGTQKERMVLQSDGLTLKFSLRSWKDTRGVAATTDVWVDDDHNEFTPRVKKTIRYHNKTRYLDEFRAGPVDGLPFQSRQESVIWLEREGGWRSWGWDSRKLPGDDLFVYASNYVKISQSGVVREDTKFRTECR